MKKAKILQEEDNYLLLSGIQHIAFCKRQWALIHIEQQWAENVGTIEGRYLHEKADDPFIPEKRKDKIILRAVPLVSHTLRITGKADVVELQKIDGQCENGILIESQEGKWRIFPVEYKRGAPKTDDRDHVQLCAQAMCLEEMNNVRIDKGAMYYGKPHQREQVTFSEELRSKVLSYVRCMHEYYKKSFTPLAVYKSHCRSCSLVDICMPKSFSSKKNVKSYLDTNLNIEQA